MKRDARFGVAAVVRASPSGMSLTNMETISVYRTRNNRVLELDE